MNKLVRKLINSLGTLLVPILLSEIIVHLEEIIKIDINKDGIIGKEQEYDN